MVRVDSKGRIVIPNDVREQLGIGPGSEVEVNAEGGRAVVEPEDSPEQVMQDLEAMIAEAATNRERRRESETEDPGLDLDEDPIAAKQREIIRRGARRTESDDASDQE